MFTAYKYFQKCVKYIGIKYSIFTSKSDALKRTKILLLLLCKKSILVNVKFIQ